MNSAKLTDSVRDLVERYSGELDSNDTEFVRRVYADGLSKYSDRLEQYGFSGKGSVLDAGCGFGQWTLALASQCREVAALDMSRVRLEFTADLADALDLGAVRTTRAPLWRTPYEDQTFSAVFCYGVLYLTPWKETIAEFGRLLEDDGLLYLNANGWGWYHHLWSTSHNGTETYNPRMVAAEVLSNTLAYMVGEFEPDGGHLLIDPDELKRELSQNGFESISYGPEGTVTLPGRSRTGSSFFKGEYMGALGVYEILARRRRSASL